MLTIKQLLTSKQGVDKMNHPPVNVHKVNAIYTELAKRKGDFENLIATLQVVTIHRQCNNLQAVKLVYTVMQDYLRLMDNIERLQFECRREELEKEL